MELKLHHGTGKVHLLSCKVCKSDTLQGQHLAEHFSLESLGYRDAPREYHESHVILVREILGEKIAQCCLGPLLDELDGIETKEMAEALGRAFSP